MKSLVLLALAAVAILPVHAQVAGVKSVYILPMGGGLDQFLALQLTNRGLLQVVTDPQKADAVLTDRLGAHLEDTLHDFKAAETKAAEKEDKDSNKDKLGVTEFARPTMQPLSRNRGAIFLVDRSSGNVLWSTFEPAPNNRADSLNHTAEKIVREMAKTAKGKS